MTNTEFLALEFGSVVFNETGVKGVVITKFEDNDITVCFEKSGGFDRVITVKVDHADTLHLEAPKKKVKKELNICIDIEMLLRIVEHERYGHVFVDTDTDMGDNELPKYENVKIIYETEE